MPDIGQRSFAAGILAPILRARSDTARYAAGARDILNMIVAKSGALVSRAGFRYAAGVKDSTKRTRVFEFAFDDIDDHYAIEFGDGYLRFFFDGARVVTSGVAAWVSTTIYKVGDLVSHGGTTYYAREASRAIEPGVTVGWQDSWYAQTGDIFEIPSPYTEADVFAVDRRQIGDYIFMAHRGHPPMELLREDHTRWTLRPMRFRPPINGPVGLTTSIMSGTGGGVRTRRVKCTVVRKGKNGEESLPGCRAPALIGTLTGGSGSNVQVNATNTLVNGNDVLVRRITPLTGDPDPALLAALVGKVFNISDRHAGDFELDGTTDVVITGNYSVEVVPAKSPALVGSVNGGAEQCIQVLLTAHGLSDGDEVLVLAVWSTVVVPDAGLVTALVEGVFEVEVIDANNFKLLETEGLTVTGGIDILLDLTWAEVTTATPTSEFDYACEKVEGAEEYRFYKDEEVGTFGFVGTSSTPSFHDAGIEPDYEITPPRLRNPFRKPGSYPGVVGTFKQRLILASTDDEPDVVWMSKPGDLRNFTQSVPLVDDDSLRFAASGNQVQQILHALDLRSLVLLTSGSAWLARGADGSSAISAPGPDLSPQDYSGSSPVRPVLAGPSALYIQARAQGLFELKYSLQGDSFGARDLASYAPHLFAGRTVVEQAFARVPHPVDWTVCSDGALLGLTYEPQEDIWAWSRHETGAAGRFKSCCVVPETDRDVLYVVVERTINGSTVQNIEYLGPRPEHEEVADLRKDYVLMDAAASYDGTYDGATPSAGLTLTLQTAPWGAGSSHTLLASAALFVVGDVGKGYRLVGADEAEVEVTVTAFTDNQHVTVTAVGAVPASLQAVATLDWIKMVGSVTGLSYLEGEDVAVLADGEDVGPLTVSAGAITLPALAGFVHVGLPYNSELRPLPMDSDTPEGTLALVKRRVPKVGLVVRSSRGFSAGPDENNLREFAMPQGSSSTALFTGEASISIPARYDRRADVLIRQSHPLPLTVLELVRSVEFGESE